MKRNNKGFTLAEMLIVVAIIGVLVAIVSTTISNSLEKAREAVDLANIRSACSEIANMAILNEPANDKIAITSKEGYYQTFVKCKSTKDKWQTSSLTTRNKNDEAFIVNNYCPAPSSERPYVRINYDPSNGMFSFVTPRLEKMPSSPKYYN